MAKQFTINYQAFIQGLEDDIAVNQSCPFLPIKKINRRFSFEAYGKRVLTYTFDKDVQVKVIMGDHVDFEVTDGDNTYLLSTDAAIELTEDLSYAIKEPKSNEVLVRQDVKDIDDCLPAYFVQMLLYYGTDLEEMNEPNDRIPLSMKYVREHIKTRELRGKLGSKLD